MIENMLFAMWIPEWWSFLLLRTTDPCCLPQNITVHDFPRACNFKKSDSPVFLVVRSGQFFARRVNAGFFLFWNVYRPVDETEPQRGCNGMHARRGREFLPGGSQVMFDGSLGQAKNFCNIAI